MAINFPNSPNTNDTHTHNGLTYIYDGTIWKLQTLDTTTSNEIIPYAYAHVRANTAGTGTNMSWGAYNSSNGDMAFTFDTALSDNLYYVLSEREQFDTHTVSIMSKTTTGFTARWLDNSGTQPLAPDIFPGVLIVYASDPTKAIGGVGGGGDRDRIIESDTSVECIDDGTGDRIVFKTAATEAVQIDANRQILISGTQSGNNVAKIYNDTDGLGTGVLGIYASSNNATPRDVRFYSGGGTANEIFRIGKDGQIGVGGDVGTAGEVLTSGGPSGAATWSAAGSGGASVTTSDTPPTSPSDGDLWWDSQNGRLNVYYQDVDSSQWVDAGGSTISHSPKLPKYLGEVQLWNYGAGITWRGTGGITATTRAAEGGGGFQEAYIRLAFSQSYTSADDYAVQLTVTDPSTDGHIYAPSIRKHLNRIDFNVQNLTSSVLATDFRASVSVYSL